MYLSNEEVDKKAPIDVIYLYTNVTMYNEVRESKYLKLKWEHFHSSLNHMRIF